MPLYDFECTECDHVQELVFKVDECPDMISCSNCRIISEINGHNISIAKKIIAFGHGGFQTETPKWIDDGVRGVLQDEAEKPIETRKELADALKRRNAEPIETSHKGLRMI